MVDTRPSPVRKVDGTLLEGSRRGFRVFFFFLGGGGYSAPPLRLSTIVFFIFKPTGVNFPLPFKFHCRIQST